MTMTTAAPATTASDAQIIESALARGDLSTLTLDERNAYYAAMCRSVGLNPLTQPFKFIVLDGSLQLYALKNCSDQLRVLHNISINSLDARDDGNVHIVHAKATTGDGRTDFDVGAVSLVYPLMRPGPKGMERHPMAGEFLTGLDRANALMTAATKAKRRVTLSLGGLGGILDETEVDAILSNGGQRGSLPAAAAPAPRPARVTPLTLVHSSSAADAFADDVPMADTAPAAAMAPTPVPEPAPVISGATARAVLVAAVDALLDAKSGGNKSTRLNLMADHFGACWPDIETTMTLDDIAKGLASLKTVTTVSSAPAPTAADGHPVAAEPSRSQDQPVAQAAPVAPDVRPSVADHTTRRVRTIEVHLGILPGQPQRTVEFPVTVGPVERAPDDAVNAALAQIDGDDIHGGVIGALKKLGENVRAKATAKKARDAETIAKTDATPAAAPAEPAPSADVIPADVTDVKKWDVDARRVNDIRSIIEFHGKSEERIVGILNGYAKVIDAMHPVHKAQVTAIRDAALSGLYAAKPAAPSA